MKTRPASFPLLLALIIAGCASPEADAPSGMADAVAVSPRPDADNPVPGNLAWPADWEIRFDRPSDDYVVTGDSSVADPDIFFTNMAPGWHVTSGPAAIYWHPASTAEGDYTASATFFQFDPGPRNEAFGLFVGGSDLAGDGQAYLYFLIRKSGEFLVKQRIGAETANIVVWTTHEAILPWSAENDPTANELGIQTEGDTISFMVNNQVVHSQEKGDLPTDGIVGFRVNHALNLHVSTFEVTPTGATAAE